MSRADELYDRGIRELDDQLYTKAIASLLAARREDPRDDQITYALGHARSTAGTAVHVDPPFPLTTRDAALAWVIVNLGVAFVVARRSSRTWLFGLASVWVLCGLGWLTLRVTAPEYAVAAKDEVVGYAADDSASLERLRVHRNDELLVVGRRGNWLKVRAPHGELAYVAADDVLSVEATR